MMVLSVPPKRLDPLADGRKSSFDGSNHDTPGFTTPVSWSPLRLSRPSQEAATTPVRKFWKKISPALAARRKNGRVPICKMRGMMPPMANSNQPVLAINWARALRIDSKKRNTENTMRILRIDSTINTTLTEGTVNPRVSAFEGSPCYRDLSSIAEKPDGITIEISLLTLNPDFAIMLSFT